MGDDTVELVPVLLDPNVAVVEVQPLGNPVAAVAADAAVDQLHKVSVMRIPVGVVVDTDSSVVVEAEVCKIDVHHLHHDLALVFREKAHLDPNGLEQLDPRIRNSHMGSTPPVQEVQVLVVEVERCCSPLDPVVDQ